MALDLKTTREQELPPRILVHGVAGIGKTSLAAEFPNPVLIDTEEGSPVGVDLPTFGVIESYGGVIDAIGALINEDHDRQTLIMDSLDGLEPMIWAETCRVNNWASIETPGYGKGYLAADKTWNEIVAGLGYLRREKRMTIILIAHSEVKTFDEPGAQPYSRYDLRLHKRGAAIVTDWVDAILFLNTKTEVKETDAGFNKTHAHAKSGGTRWIFTDARPAFIAKNRCAAMPAQMQFHRGRGYADLAPHFFPGEAPAKAARAA